MAQHDTNGYPFDSVFTGLSTDGFPQGDRDGSAADLAAFTEFLIDDGVSSGSLEVTAGSGLDVMVGGGTIMLRGRLRYFSAQTLTLEPAPEARDWNIVVRLDTDKERRMWCFATTNEPVETEFVKDFVLAKVKVNANQTIVAGVQDTRRYTKTHTSMPQGIVCMWSGSIASIPAGWALCNGQNGTPNLQNRFIVGAGGTYSPGNTGGADSVSLTVAQLASHAHDTAATGTGSSGTIHGGNLFHEPRSQTSYTGSNASHENRPPYYALAFIMKL